MCATRTRDEANELRMWRDWILEASPGVIMTVGSSSDPTVLGRLRKDKEWALGFSPMMSIRIGLSVGLNSDLYILIVSGLLLLF